MPLHSPRLFLITASHCSPRSYTFCGLAAVLLAGADPWEHLNLPLLLDWLVFRQGSVEGGFQGRSNKLVDACYSLWQGGLFPLLALCSPPCLPNGDASSAQQPNNVSLSPRSDCISGDQQAVQAGSGEGRGVAGESGGVAGDSVQEGRGAEGCSSGSEGGGGDQRGGDGAEDEEADEDENEEEDEEDEWEEADVESFHRVPLAAAADLFPCPESLLPPAGAGEGGERTGGKRGGGEESGGEGEEGREGAADAVGGESGDRATARGGRDCVGSFCYSDVALQAYLLLCCQVPEGGLRDKPGKARDYYHTCYALSGLTAAQHSHPVTLPHTHAPQQAAASMAQGVGGSVLGPVSNLLAVAEPRCNRNFSFSASLRTQKCFDASVLNSRLVLLQAKSNLLSSARSSLRSSKSACMRGLPSSGRLLIATLTRSIQSHRAQSPCAPHSSFLQSAPKVVWALFPGGALGSPRALGAAHVSELGRQVISARGLTSAQAAPRMGDKRKANGEGVAENKKSKAAVAVEEGSAGAGGAAGGGGEVMGGPSGFKVLKEGAAEILVQGNDVFYNKAQVVNRDLSVCVLRALVTVRREEENQRAAAVVAGVKGRALLKHLNADLAAKSAAAAAAKLRGGEKGGGAEKGEGGEKGEVGDRKGEDKEVLEGEGRAAEGAAGGEAGERKEKSGEEGDGAAAMIEGAEAGEGQQQQQQQLAKVAEVKPLRILEGLAASGLRSIRYAKEIPGVGTVVALDNDPVAVQACQRNVAHNFGGAPPPAATASDAAVAAEGEGGEGKEEGKGGEGKPASEEGKGEGEAAVPVRAEQGDARVYMIVHEKQFDAVDLDPYGTPSVFLDGAVQAVADGGMLLVTATDMAVLCGNNAEVCYSKYGAYPHRAKYCHEMAIRILLASIESAANRFKRHIVPVLSVSVDFYIRVFVRVFTSAQAVKATPSKLAYVFQCSGCDSYHLQPVGRVVEGRTKKPDAPPPPPRYLPGLGPVIPPACEHCGRHLSIGGPMWSAPIHDASWVRLVLGEVQAGKARLAGFGKVHGLLTAVSEELHDIPLYLDLHEISATLKCTPPSMLLFRSALVNAGHRVSGAHSNPLGIKTDAPLGLVWDVMRCWIRDHPVKSQGEGSPADTILAKPPTTE
ncbi:unnamed protein product, partial [Closterium sp. NIES-54]